MPAKLQEQLSPTDAEVILGRLPERIRLALVARASEIEYPVEAVVEMAIASFLDSEALGFVDVNRGVGNNFDRPKIYNSLEITVSRVNLGKI